MTFEKVPAVAWRPLKVMGRRLNKRRRTLSRKAKNIKRHFTHGSKSDE